MKKIAVVYWSGTGNTGAMADAILKGIKQAGAEAEVFWPNDFSADMTANYDAIAFGCSAQGAETLEEGEFEPMFAACEPVLNGKTVALFGSYGWGDGEWMRSWEDRCKAAGMQLAEESLIINDMPDEDGLALCRAFGAQLAV